jgi:phosphoribosylanthranilate isomerase
MHRTRIKICGVTRPEDAAAAARCGADFVGLVLHADSPRAIDIDRAKEILTAPPAGVTGVGVFVDASADRILRCCDALGIEIAQLHGREPIELVRELAKLTVWKALRIDGEPAVWRGSALNAILLETASSRGPGGTGEQNDWARIRGRQLAGEFDGFSRVIAAGGLTPANVGDVVRLIHPWAVDVSSGVESGETGVKSEEKIAAFVRAVREADASITSA